MFLVNKGKNCIYIYLFSFRPIKYKNYFVIVSNDLFIYFKTYLTKKSEKKLKHN